MILTALLDEALRHATFDGGRSELLSLEQLRHAYLQRQADSSRLPAPAIWARARVSDEPLAKLTAHLRTMLADFLHSERDHVGVISALSPASEPSIEEFALTLVRVSAALGVEPTARLVADWADGAPFTYRLKTLLSVAPEGPLALDDGISIHPPPTEHSMPRDEWVARTVQHYGYFEFLHCPIMSIDCARDPVFYPAGKENPSVASVLGEWARAEVPDRFLDTFCESLSLACNTCVRHGSHWYDYGSLEEFCNGTFGWSPSLGPRLHPDSPLSQRQLDLARDIHQRRYQAPSTTRLDTAISRWIKSKHPYASLPDRFIDLRIALEALYLEDRAELGYRLATNAAWYLGRDVDERATYFSTAKKAYNRASDAVHASEIPDDPANRELLSSAQDACREGILKRLNESSPPDWSRLVLGDKD